MCMHAEVMSPAMYRFTLYRPQVDVWRNVAELCVSLSVQVMLCG